MHDTPHDPFDVLKRKLQLKRVTAQWENAGDCVMGEVVDIADIDNGYGHTLAITVETDGGDEVTIPGFGTVLQRVFTSHPIEPGDLLAVQFNGLKATANGSAYKDFTVVHTNPDGTPKRRRSRAGEGDRIEEPDPFDDEPEPF